MLDFLVILGLKCFSTPLPPLPMQKSSVLENGSNRSSGSSGNYGHLVEHFSSEYDNVYTKPIVCL